MSFQLFGRFESAVEKTDVTRDLFSLLEQMRESVGAQVPEWTAYPTFRDYAAICSWAIRKLEYSFIAEAFDRLRKASSAPLRVLDVGCGVVPLCNWMSRQGALVDALDPSRDDISFLVRNDLNAYFGSAVRYQTARCELLPFADESFDLVTCVSVLEHISPGNDRLALWEIARVLKPGGHLLITFDVAPPASPQEGEIEWPPHRRRHAQPFTPEAAGRLLEYASAGFEVDARNLPPDLPGLSWTDVHSFWQTTQEHDHRAEATREYLAMGGVITRRPGRGCVLQADILAAHAEAQSALEERLGFFQYHAGQRLTAIGKYHSTLRDVEAAAEARRAIIVEQTKALEEQGKELERYRRWNWVLQVRRRLAPRLGVLNQYPPKPLVVPEHYERCQSPAFQATISIVTPSYNQADFLERTIRSVVDQGYPGVEYIVQDGASTDHTVSVLEQYQGSLMHWESAKDNGQSHAINLGFRHATGEIMAYLNSDDVLLPGSLSYVANFFATHPKIDVVYGHRVIIDEDDEEVGIWVLPPHDDEVLKWADYVPQETLFWRRRIWEAAGGEIDESFRFAMDWDLLLRFRDAGARFARVPRFLAAFRVHQNQKTSSQMSEIGAKEMDRLRERCHHRPVSGAEVAKRTGPYLDRHVIYHNLYRAGILKY